MIDKTWGGTPVYARFGDNLEARDAESMRYRRTQVYMHQEKTNVLCIATLDGKGDYKWARLTVEQVVQLRDSIIPEFLADQYRPQDELITRTVKPIPDPRVKPNL